MKCDYYQITALQIFFKDNETYNIILNKEKHFYKEFNSLKDSDDEGYEEEYKLWLKTTNRYCDLKIKVPIIIYENDKFIKETFEEKYKDLILKKISKDYEYESEEYNYNSSDSYSSDGSDKILNKKLDDILKIEKYQYNYDLYKKSKICSI